MAPVRFYATMISMRGFIVVLLNLRRLRVKGIFQTSFMSVILFTPILTWALSASDLIIRDNKPATKWQQEALPIGNAYQGAMIYSGVHKEQIQFNEESLWVGDEEDTGKYQAFGDVLVEFDREVINSYEVTCPSQHGSPNGQGIDASHDGDPTTKWCLEHGNRFPVIWQQHIQSDQKEIITKYTLTSANDVPSRDPKSWRLLGSQDGLHWTPLDDRKDIPVWSARHSPQTFTFKNETHYAWYRFEFLSNHDVPHFQMGEIFLGEQSSPSALEKVDYTDYLRELDISKAIHTVTYKKNGVSYRRESFASYPARAMFFRFTADKPGAISGVVALTDKHKATIAAKDNTITSVGSLGGAINLSYEAQLAVINEGGSLVSSAKQICFSKANSVTLILSCGTNFLQDRTKGWKGVAPHEAVTARLETASKRKYGDILEEHVRDYQSLFNRVTLDLGSSPHTNKTTLERILAQQNNRGFDPGLEQLLFQFGRYLMISTSRPGSVPANLQGKWNESNNPPWRCDYHTDINIQMNYWPVEVANLSECFSPYAEWVESIRAVRTAATKKAFNKRGWLMRGESGLFGGSTWDWIPGTSAWILMNSFEHYRFNGDKDYLRTRAYPAMKEVCEYWIDSLAPNAEGQLVTPVGLSPEHGPKEMGISFDQQQVWELFTNTIEASEALNIDPEFRQQLISMKARLLQPKIGRWGQLQEWMVDRDDPKNKHRHISHLIALFPGRQISPSKTPNLAEAARITLNARGDESVGWSIANKTILWARLLDGERAYKIMRNLLKLALGTEMKYDDGGGVYANLLAACPPFQIDANFGYTAGICEMLIQSHLDEIHLLPALPKAWPNGSVKGLRARNSITVDITWKDGLVTDYRIYGKNPNKVNVRVNGELKSRVVQDFP